MANCILDDAANGGVDCASDAGSFSNIGILMSKAVRVGLFSSAHLEEGFLFRWRAFGLLNAVGVILPNDAS